ncbi:hypothetical protein FQR65_LT07856 [Abscondita terminalis]|nr:hypothetical protein FQR65_LT07856 [Abscondita terminalis]
MDFAKRQLEKYGWQEGSGLGKNANGISEALKPVLKFDNAGLGHSTSEQFTNNWWETLYNKSSNNVKVVVQNDRVKFKVKDKDVVEINTKNQYIKTKISNDLKYGSFIKSSKLTESDNVKFDFKNMKAETDLLPSTSTLTDEELFAICGRRTAHKGARHGLKLNGKLSRLEMQEKLLLKKLNKFTLSDEEAPNKKSIEKKLKKINYHKSKNRNEEDMDILPPTSPCILNVHSPYKSNKKRKGERRHVSFSETVVEYQTQETDVNEASSNIDLNGSSHSEGTSRSLSPITKVIEVKIKDKFEIPNVMVTDLDEGIDCSDYDPNKEKTKHDLQEKIRKENRRMKRKLKKLRKLNKMQESSDETALEIDFSPKDNSEMSREWAKRKLFEEPEFNNALTSKRCHYEHSCKLKKKQKLLKKQRQLEKNIDKVANSFDNICKISGVQHE